MFLELTALVILIAAIVFWRRRVPTQNLLAAAVWIIALAAGPWLLLHGRPQRWIDFPWSALLITLATIPTARQAAAELCSRIRTSSYYGVSLTALAALVATVPIGTQFHREYSLSLGLLAFRPGYWIAVYAGCLTAYLVTLPYWLDKRQSAGLRRD